MDVPQLAAPREVPPVLLQVWQSAISDPDPLVALGATRALVAMLASWEAKLASEAVGAGATWEAVGSSVGVSRQAAWQRFHEDVEVLGHEVKSAARKLKQRERAEWKDFRDDARWRARGGAR